MLEETITSLGAPGGVVMGKGSRTGVFPPRSSRTMNNVKRKNLLNSEKTTQMEEHTYAGI